MNEMKIFASILNNVTIIIYCIIYVHLQIILAMDYVHCTVNTKNLQLID